MEATPFHYIAIGLLAFAPGLFWLWMFYRWDKIEPEPRKLVLKVFFCGMWVAIPVVFVNAWAADPLALITSSFLTPRAALVVLGAPVIEEFFKYLVVGFVVYDDPEFDEPMDGIVYAAAAALGFASVENVIYLVTAYLEPRQTIGATGPHAALTAVLVVFSLRALLTVPGHAVWSSMWGYALGCAKFRPEGRRVGLVVKGLLLAMFLHAAFNALLAIDKRAALGMLVLVPVMWRMLYRRIAQALDDSPHARRDA